MTSRRANHAKGGLGRYSHPPAVGARTLLDLLGVAHLSGRPRVMALAGTGFLATAGAVGIGVLSASTSDAAVLCVGPPPLSDGAGNTCTSGVNATAIAGAGTAVSADSSTTDTGAGRHSSTSSDITVFSSGSDTALDNRATADGTGAVAVAGSDQAIVATQSLTISGNVNTATLGEDAADSHTGDFAARNDTAIANGAEAIAVAGSDEATIENESATISGNDNMVSLGETASNIYIGDFTADDDTAIANGVGSLAIAGSNEVSTEENTATLVGDGGVAIVSSVDSHTISGDVTASNDTAIATAAPPSPEAPTPPPVSSSPMTTPRLPTEPGERHRRQFTGAAGTTHRATTPPSPTAPTVELADSTANGKGNTAITVALGPTAVAASPTSVYTSAGTGSVAVALDSSGGFSLSVDGLTF